MPKSASSKLRTGRCPSLNASTRGSVRTSPRRRTPQAKPLLVPLEALRPTQVAIGMRAVAAKREKVAERAGSVKKISRFLEKRPIPAVLGPGEGLYIIDHHHLSLALWQSDVREAFIQVVGDLSRLPRNQFWSRMSQAGWLHLFDEWGRRIHPSLLPQSLCALRTDPYRDLAWSVREAGGFVKSGIPFAEFRWAEYFRSRIPKSAVCRDFDCAHDRAMMLARSDNAAQLPGFVGVGR